jgi:hypothetical protein
LFFDILVYREPPGVATPAARRHLLAVAITRCRLVGASLCFTSGERTVRRLSELTSAFPWLQVLNSRKTGPVQPDFVAPCTAPVDFAPNWSATHRYEGCSVSSHCGIAMNFAGFYPCALAGAIDRIFRLDQSIKSLADVTEAAMIARHQTFCRLCGYYRPIRAGSQTLLSPAWRAALDRYRTHEVVHSLS